MSPGAAQPCSLIRPGSPWQERYAFRHGYFRLAGDPSMPNGRRGRVTIYQRGHNPTVTGMRTFILSWCAQGRRSKERFVGDLFAAVGRADEINKAIAEASTPVRTTKVGVDELATRFIEYQERRADAGEISSKTPGRYRSALDHLIAFAREDREPTKREWVPNRDLVLRFKAHLQGTLVGAVKKPDTGRLLSSKGMLLILATARAMVRWAVEEGLLPASAAVAFMQAGRDRATHHTLSEVPLDTDEIVRLIAVADAYQLALFSFHILHGVRVAEPCWLMHEFVDIEKGWIDYRCIEELAYRTKGRIDKRLPIPSAMRNALQPWMTHGCGGLVLLKRRYLRASGPLSRRGTGLQAIIQQVHASAPKGWSQRGRVAADLLKKHGAIEGDDVRREFKTLLSAAGISREVTPKALRHHFATALEKAGVPYYTRKYLLGHRLSDRGGRGSDITAIYTHLEPDFVKATYQRVLDGPLAKIVDAFGARLTRLAATTKEADATSS